MCREIADSCKNNWVVLLGDFNFPDIDWFSHSHSTEWTLLNMSKKVSLINISRALLKKTPHGGNLLLGNGMRQVPEVSMPDYNSTGFQIVTEKNRIDPQVKVINWRKADFGGIKWELAEVDWESHFVDKEGDEWHVRGFHM